MMEAIILAGGRGTRLSGVVPDLPKPMAPIGDRPFLTYLLKMLIEQGVSQICISTGYKAEAIEEYFGTEYCGARIVYAREESPLGTGGAVRSALSLTAAQDVFVLNGDTIASVDLPAMHMQHEHAGNQLTVALTQVSDCSRYGAVYIRDGCIARFSEKGISGTGFVNVGVYLIRRCLFDEIQLPDAFSFEKEILVDRLGVLSVGVFLTSGYFIDIGVPEDYARAQFELPSVAR